MTRICTAVLALAVSAGAASGSSFEQIPVVRLTAETTIAASPEAIWSAVTTGKSLVTWCPYWKSDANAKVVLDSVGDALDFTDSWGNGGRSVVTYLSPETEIRIAHEPNDGSYLCQAKLTLTPEEGGTKLRYVEQYTDESKPEDMQATAEQMKTEMDETLARLKGVVEGTGE